MSLFGHNVQAISTTGTNVRIWYVQLEACISIARAYTYTEFQLCDVTRLFFWNRTDATRMETELFDFCCSSAITITYTYIHNFHNTCTSNYLPHAHTRTRHYTHIRHHLVCCKTIKQCLATYLPSVQQQQFRLLLWVLVMLLESARHSLNPRSEALESGYYFLPCMLFCSHSLSKCIQQQQY